MPFRKWLNGPLGKEYVRGMKEKKDLFQELTGVDFVTYALEHPSPWDRSAWAVLSISKWMDLYKVSV